MKEVENFELNFKDKFGLLIQRLFGWITFPLWGGVSIFLMRFVSKYQIQHIHKIRKQYQEILKQAKGPVILCANHLTKIDSALITWSLGSVWANFKSLKFLSWNLPERSRYFSNIFLRAFCYLGRCIPVDRGGPRTAVRKSLDKIRYLLNKGDTVTIFPEGQRSRSGKIDACDYSYGVGQLIKAVKDCKVLCIYMRGHGQEKFSSLPRFGEKFYFDMKAIEPQSIYQGVRATRDLAKQVIDQLLNMEQNYFALYRQ